MNDYIYHNTTKIIFGRSAEKYIGSECKALADGGKVLLLLGGGSAKKSGLYDKVVASLNESGRRPMGFLQRRCKACQGSSAGRGAYHSCGRL